MSYWRVAGLNYIQYSQVCAQLVRNVLKEQHKALAARRETQSLKLFKWEGGKQGPVSTVKEI